jgi:hypothetical protein
MPERISRPAVRLKGGLPDGITLNGLAGADGKHFLKGEPAPKFFVGKVGRRQLIHDDEAGSDVAVLEVLELEVPADAGQLELERLILSYRDVRTSDGTLPFHQPAYQSNDAERAADLRYRIQVWCDLNSRDPNREWRDLFGDDQDAPVGPTGASLMNLLTFCEEKGIATKDEPGESGEDGGSGVVHHGGAYAPEHGDIPADDADQDDDDEQAEADDDEPAPGRVVQFSGKAK